LARGDAFKKKWAAKILNAYNMLPIYRQSEGVANLQHNANSFELCQQLLKQNKTILIFVEGLCENNWQLRPLKKGVARLVQQAWQTDKTAHTQIIPVALTYQHFNGAGKSLIINIGNGITKTSLAMQQTSLAIPLNQIIQNQLQQLMLQYSFLPNTETHKNFINYWFDAEKKYAGIELFNALKKFNNQTATTKSSYNKFAFTIILWPNYLICKYISKRLTTGTVFFDSVLFMLLVFCLPVYLLMVWLFVETLIWIL